MVASLTRSAVVCTAQSLALVAPLLLALACSAPPGSEDDADTVPAFPSSGNGGPVTSTGAVQPATNSAGASNAGSTSGAGGSTSTETPGTNVGLSPTPMGSAGQNSNMGQPMMGAAGSTSNGGAAGASGSMAPGNAGSSAMPPGGNNPPPANPPSANPPPTNPPPTNPPPAANANCPGQFLCEDFEGVAAGASPSLPKWQVIEGYGMVTQSASVQVSTQQAHTGTRSLRVVASGSRNGIVATLPQNRYFLRAWLQVDAVPLGPVFIGLGTDQNSETRLRIQGRSFAVINTVGPGDAVHPSEANSGNCPSCVTLTPNRWFCAEFSIDNAARTATLWIDGAEAASIVPGQEWPVQPAAPKLFLGSMGVQGGQAGVFIDDVAVGSTRIGCD